MFIIIYKHCFYKGTVVVRFMWKDASETGVNYIKSIKQNCNVVDDSF